MGHREQLGPHCSHYLENDAGEMHHPAAEGYVPRSCRHCDHQAAAKRFGERFIAMGTSVTWPPRSPDLTPPAFRLWVHLKEGTYKREPWDLPELKTSVTECVRAVTARGCRTVIVEVRRNVEICLARNGRQSDHLLLFTGRGSNGDDKPWTRISNDHGSILAPNNVSGVTNTRAGSERNVSVFSETPCTL